MSKSKHGEPWRFQHGRDITDEGYSAIVDCNGKQIGDDEDDRIIACVNALAGIENPGALPALLARIEHALADDPNGRLAGIRGAFDVMMGDRT